MPMPPVVTQWCDLILRWTHVFVGILWVGETYYLIRMEGRLTAAENAARAAGEDPQVWLVQGVGFQVTHRQRTPAALPSRLYWFRWEAALTWLTGFLLLGLLYYSDGLLLDPNVARISMGAGVAIGLAVLIVGWTVYDLLWMSPLGRSPLAAGAVSFLLVVALAYGLTHVLSGRAAYIHVGALFGTIMAANVWMRILPAQRKWVAAVRAGQKPDVALAAQARIRARHNTLLAVPVVFLMISNHFPIATYGQRYNWLILSVLVLAGAFAANLLTRP
jgi:uncharacterized membrane protein